MPIKSRIRTVPHYPKQGIMFRDITTLLKDPVGFRITIHELANRYTGMKIDKIAAIESRGFILASAIAIDSDVGFIPIRKAGKLPGAVIKREYGLEYGSDALEMHCDALSNVTDPRVLLIDDVLATGGTLIAALELINDLNGVVTEVVVLLEISALGGRERINDAFPALEIRALVTI